MKVAETSSSCGMVALFPNSYLQVSPYGIHLGQDGTHALSEALAIHRMAEPSAEALGSLIHTTARPPCLRATAI